MGNVLGIAIALGDVGVIASFGSFGRGERAFQLTRDAIQTLTYLKLSMAGHLTIFVTRTRGPFWSIRPAWALVLAGVITQILAALIAAYGLFMTPIRVQEGTKIALTKWPMIVNPTYMSKEEFQQLFNKHERELGESVILNL
jgi:hypothetical protein